MSANLDNSFTSANDPVLQDGARIDFKRVLYRALQYWYFIILSIVVALISAYFINRYSVPIYEIHSSFIIRETQESNESKILYDNPLINASKNYFNELYIVRSIPLIERVIDKLNFDVSFYRDGKMLTLDAYDYIPVKARVISRLGSKAKQFQFKMISDTQYELGQEAVHQLFLFGDTISFGGIQLVVEPKEVSELQFYKNESFFLTIADEFSIARSYSNRLEASWAEVGASVVNLRITGENSQREVDFLNGLMEEYQSYDIEKKNQSATRSIEFIREQILSIRDSLLFFEVQLQKFKNENVVTDLSNEAMRIFQKLETLENEKTILLVNENYYKYLRDYLNNSQNLGQVILPSSMGILDPILSKLVGGMIDLQMEVKSYMSVERTENPMLQNKRRQINSLRQDILESLVTLAATDNIKKNQLDKEIKLAEKQLAHLPSAERQLVSIQRNYTLLENLLVFLMQKKSEAEITKASNASDIFIVNPPLASGSISPKRSQNYSIAFMIGLLLPFGLFTLMELFNTRIQSKEDIEVITSIPFIGGIGHNVQNTNLIVYEKSKSTVAEAFRSLRSNINYFTGYEGKKIILITSSISGEGKTFTTLNLATVLAFSGKRTLIIGADMRKPKLYDDFNLSNSFGLSTFLSGLSTIEEVIQPTFVENLFLISSGPVPPNPSELMLKPLVSTMFNKLKESFDYIILDSPPIALITDAFVLTQYADHTVYVVRQDFTPKDTMRIVQDYYHNGRLKNVSIVLNDIRKSGPGYGYGYYNYGYGYGAETKPSGYYTED